MGDEFRDLMSSKRFDVEQAIVLYAYSHILLPAHVLYSDGVESALGGKEKNCHIYLVGKCPKVDLVQVVQREGKLLCEFESLNIRHVLDIDLPEETELIEELGVYCLRNKRGENFFPTTDYFFARLANETNFCDFEVLYIGQAFGKNGSRNALNRLRSHETLQRISLTMQDDKYYLNTLMLDVHSNQAILTLFNPWAKVTGEKSKTFSNGIDFLKNMSGGELVTIYEAALIRYFEPKFNKIFKNSFPSTQLDVLKNCYDTDINSVVAEINFEDFAFRLWSEKISPRNSVIAQFDLHADQDRRVFFGR